MTKVKILSDGTGPGTRVWIDGTECKNVAEIRWSIRHTGFADVTLRLTDVALDVDGQMAMKYEEPPRHLPVCCCCQGVGTTSEGFCISCGVKR